MIPIRTIIVRQGGPVFHPGRLLGDVESSAAAQERLKKDLKKAAITSAAASMGVQIGLMFVPVVGWAASGIISLVQSFTGKRYERKTKAVIQQTVNAIKAHQERSTAEVQAVLSAAFTKEYPAARVLAASTASLGGFGSSLKKAVKKATKAVTKAVTTPIKKVTQHSIKAVAKVAEATGHDRTAKRLENISKQTGKVFDTTTNMASDPWKTARILTGEEGYRVASARCAELKKTAIAEMDKEKARVIALANSPEYQARLRVTIAKGLRGDTSILEGLDANEAEALRNVLAQQKAALDMPAEGESADGSKAAPLLVGSGLAVAALLFMR